MLYKSNADKILSKIRGLFSQRSMDGLYLEVAQTLYASNAARVHNKGQAADGSPIGKYSREPLYVNPSKSPRQFPVKGKDPKSSSKFKNGNSRKTRYFGDGWAGYKRQIGFSPTKVNLQNFGRLKADWQVAKIPNGYVLGFGAYGAPISIGNEKRFGKTIWGISKQDKVVTASIIKRYMNASSK